MVIHKCLAYVGHVRIGEVIRGLVGCLTFCRRPFDPADSKRLNTRQFTLFFFSRYRHLERSNIKITILRSVVLLTICSSDVLTQSSEAIPWPNQQTSSPYHTNYARTPCSAPPTDALGPNMLHWCFTAAAPSKKAYRTGQ